MSERRRDFTGIIDDLKLIRFFEGDRRLSFSNKHLTNASLYYRNKLAFDDENLSIISNKTKYHKGKTNKILRNYFVYDHIELYDTMCLAKGKMSVCGSYILSIIDNLETCSDEIHIYFHSCLLEQAKNLLLNFANKLQGIPFYKKGNTEIYVDKMDKRYIFHCSVFEDKEDILSNIGNAPKQFGWNPIDGYFSTITAMFVLILGITLIHDKYDFYEISTFQYFNKIIFMSSKSEISSTLPSEVDIKTMDVLDVYDYECNFLCYEWCYVNKHQRGGNILKEVGDISSVEFFVHVKNLDQLPERTTNNIYHQPTFTGMFYYRYKVFRRFMKLLQPDIFSYLLSIWFTVEVEEAKRRLLRY